MGQVYKSHPIWTLITQVKAVLEQENFSSDTLVSHGVTHIRDQVIAINDFIFEKIARTPDAFISEFGTNQLTAQYQSLMAELLAFTADGNVARLNSVKTRVDQQIMPLLWTFAPVLSPDADNVVSSTYENLQKQSESSLKIVLDREEKIKMAFDALATRITLEEENLKGLGETLALQKADALAVTAQVQQAYAEQETKRSGAFTALLDTQKNLLLKQEEETKDAANNLISDLKKSRDDAARLVEAVGNLGTTGNYKNIADREAKQANLWRWFAAGIFVLGMAMAIFTFKRFLDTPYSPENVISALIRLMYAIVITTPAWYAARESARHRSNSDRARQTELELAALGPFIELMPEDKKISIRENLITTYFGNTSTPHVVEPSLQPNELAKIAAEKIGTAKPS